MACTRDHTTGGRMTNRMMPGMIHCTLTALMIGLGCASLALADGGPAASTPGDQGVEERAVPQFGTSGKTGVTQGFVLQDSQIVAKPGYVLERRPDGSVVARQITSGGRGSSYKLDCTCPGKGGGDCVPSSSGDVAVCSKSASDPCRNECTWAPGLTSPLQLRPQ
jgi:hypothetical protein